MALRVNRERHQLGIAVALADLRCFGGSRDRSLEVACGLVAEHDRQQGVAVNGRLLRHVLDQPVRACQPSARGTDRPSVEERDTDPARAVRGAGYLALLEVGVVRPLEDLDRLVVAREHACGRRPKLEIHGRNRLRLVRTRERPEGLQPRARGVCGAGALEIGRERGPVHSEARAAAIRSGLHLLQPWKDESSPASQASRSPGAARSQSGRISRVASRRSRRSSSTDGRPQNQ